MACQAKQARAMLEQNTTSKSRQILMVLAAKLQEKDVAMEQVRSKNFDLRPSTKLKILCS